MNFSHTTIAAGGRCRRIAPVSSESRDAVLFRWPIKTQSAFTMVEIAISLAIIGIALVAIVGVLPMGMNVQRANREATIINQDASVFLEAIRNGSSGYDDLTNYVYGITNYQTPYNANGNPSSPTVTLGYSGFGSGFPAVPWLTNGFNIIGLLSTPEYVIRDGDGNLVPTNNLYSGGFSNHIFAYVRSISGAAVEKPPQDNDIVRDSALSYRIFCVNAPVPLDTNVFSLTFAQQAYSRQLAANLHELRLTFQWPMLPSGQLPVQNARQTYRVPVAGQVEHIYQDNLDLYFYQPQSFTNAP
jgi:prepilin-type N-terminal cleavage/methylation domain-containing protein